MGTTASAHKTAVKSISIDQNGWSRPCSASRGSSAASRRSLPMLSNIIGNKSPRNNGLTKADRIRLVDRAMRAEAAAADCETKMRGMEREIRTLELRNHDLSTEVCWLRQQCTIPCPDVKLCRDRMGGAALPPASSSFEHKAEIVAEDVESEQSPETERKDSLQIFEEKRGPDENARPIRGPAKPSNIRVLTSRPRPTLRHIFAAGKEINIDGKARPSTAIDSSPSASFVRPPLERGDTVPMLRSIEVLPGIPRGKTQVEKPNGETVKATNGTNDDPYFYVKDMEEDSDADSDIDISDILENSHKSMAMSQRSQSSKSRDSGFCRGDSISTRSVINNNKSIA
ncbi:hypothetical protein OESDEN_08804 [Oesophagostomum dentatum]|uniref:Uncharacterized protein n=1 Tax=Oesophagostomum dentatum TaxID=61180 RepID=A0A0B1T7G2_OESDE|nr:hypothetical protein OESDEN_08804 [Oesophagostomum dentatum]